MYTVVCLKSAVRRPFLIHYIHKSSSSHGAGLLSHYEVLGVEKEASSADIREAFLKLSKECHPDLNSHNQKNHDRFVQVNEAYSVLIRAVSRKDYDLSLQTGIRHSAYHQSWAHQRGHVRQHRYGNDASSGNTNEFMGREFHDPYIYSMRDKSKDQYYENQPYYGVKGLSRISDDKIVLVCIGIIFVASFFHFFAVRKSSNSHIKTLNERDMKTSKLWQDAHNPSIFDQRLQLLKNKIEGQRINKKGE